MKQTVSKPSPVLIAPADDLPLMYAALVRDYEALRAAYTALWTAVHGPVPVKN